MDIVDDDPLAVLHSDFKVRGTEGLRVVDASVFPKIPGFFISLPLYMVSAKASDDSGGAIDVAKRFSSYFSALHEQRKALPACEYIAPSY